MTWKVGEVREFTFARHGVALDHGERLTEWPEDCHHKKYGAGLKWKKIRGVKRLRRPLRGSKQEQKTSAKGEGQ